MFSLIFHGSLVVYMYLYFFYVICLFTHPPSMNMVHDNFLDALFLGGGKFLTTWNMVSVNRGVIKYCIICQSKYCITFII